MGYRQLKVWHLASEVSVEIHQLTDDRRCRAAPHLVLQIRRAASSVPDNIAEGKDSGTDPQFRRFLNIAHGSAGEAGSQLTQLRNLNVVDQHKAAELLDKLAQLQRMIIKLKKVLT